MNEHDVNRDLETCVLCPRRCGVNRLSGERGPCGAGSSVRLASAAIHKGEEPPISGTRGSGTLFFSHCPLTCCFCQNFPISHMGHGKDISIKELTQRMLTLERKGAHNINCVTGTHFSPHIIAAVADARQQGMSIPIVWNTSGFETPETLDMLKGTVDIYLTDIKYARDDVAARLTGAKNYFEIACSAAEQMFEQVGPLVLDSNDIGQKGLVIRHMVLPNGLADTDRIMQFIHDRFENAVPVSLMAQYFPTPGAKRHSDIARSITKAEYRQAKNAAEEVGITEGWFQEMDDPTLKRGA